jgi:hypothetical protein
MTRRTRRDAPARSTALAVILALVLMAPALTMAAFAVPTKAEAAGPITNGMIATFAWRTGAHISDDLDLVVMKADGSGARVLVGAAARRSLCGFDLDWSPDGNRIAWASGGQVWSIRADGTDRQHLADGCVSHLEWSPDGGTLAVEIDGRTGLLSVPGGGFAWLRGCAYGEGGATFSPDGSRISTVATADCDDDPTGWGIYGFNRAGGTLDARYADTNLRGQPPTSMLDAIPNSAEWHPTQDLVLLSMDDGSEGGTCHPLGQAGSWNNADLFTVTATPDSPLTKLGSTSGEFELWERDASWSPDGQRILFAGDRNVSCQGSSYVHSGVELFSMNADGSSTTRIWTPWSVELGFVGSSWQPCTSVTITCVPPPEPDTDGDGVPDAGDACPTAAGPASNSGCPVEPPPDGGDGGDADADGVQNATDACPTVPGPLSNQGCPLPPPPVDPVTADPDDDVKVSASGTNGTIGSRCGKATFDWRTVTKSKTSVKKGETACVFLVGNDPARDILLAAKDAGVSIGTAFTGTVLKELVADNAGTALEKAAESLTKRKTLARISKVVGVNLGRYNMLFTAGKVAGVLAVPLAGAFVVGQIKNNDACIQVIVDPEGDEVKVDWSMVYAHSDDPDRTTAKVYRKKNGIIDTAEPAPLGMRCAPNGTVSVSGSGTKPLSAETSTFIKLR